MNAGRTLILEIGLLTVLFFAPLFFGCVYPWGFMAVSALIFFLLFCYPQAVFEIKSLPRAFTAGFAVIFLFVIFQCLAGSLNPHATGRELLKWTAASAAFLLVQLLSRRSIVGLLGALVMAGGLEALYGFIQTRMPQETVLWRIKEFQLGFATGSYFNRNHLAGFLELCLGINLAFLLISFRRHHRLLCFGAIFLTIMTFAGLLLTGSRMGFFSFMFSLFLLCFFIPVKEDRYRMFFAIGFLTLLAFVVGRPLWDLRLQEITDKIQPWEGGRLTVWKDALGMLKDHPWLGIGLGNFEWVFPRYQSETLLMGWAHAHSDYLELLIELGVPAFAVLLGALSMIFLRLFRKLPSLDADASTLVWGGLVSSTAFLIHGLTDFNFAIPANAFIFILLIGVMYRLSSLSGEKITMAL